MIKYIDKDVLAFHIFTDICKSITIVESINPVEKESFFSIWKFTLGDAFDLVYDSIICKLSYELNKLDSNLLIIENYSKELFEIVLTVFIDLKKDLVKNFFDILAIPGGCF